LLVLLLLLLFRRAPQLWDRACGTDTAS